jgi:hypothetical protein
MKESKLINFKPRALKKQMLNNLVEVQTQRFIEYAENKIRLLGDAIQLYDSRNHMDRTGNLLNSLCWVVTYGTSRKISGFYRTPKTGFKINRWGEERGMGNRDSYSSFLHEWSDPTGEEVVGVQRAMDFIESFKGSSGKWKVAFAVLAPYWGYWESGFTLRSGGGNSGIPRRTRFMQFQVMTHIFDDVRTALKPAETHLTVYVDKYSYKANSRIGKKFKNKPFTKRLKLD